MKLTRRKILISTVAAIPLIGGGITGGIYWTRDIESDIKRSIRTHFGKQVANSDGAREFIAGFAAEFREKNGPKTTKMLSRRLLKASYSDETRPERDEFTEVVVEKFIKSTNAVRAFETGDDVVFVGLSDPLGPCENTWGANWL